jgi:hypothetical protein
MEGAGHLHARGRGGGATGIVCARVICAGVCASCSIVVKTYLTLHDPLHPHKQRIMYYHAYVFLLHFGTTPFLCLHPITLRCSFLGLLVVLVCASPRLLTLTLVVSACALRVDRFVWGLSTIATVLIFATYVPSVILAFLRFFSWFPRLCRHPVSFMNLDLLLTFVW